MIDRMKTNDRSGPSIGSIMDHPSTRVEKSDVAARATQVLFNVHESLDGSRFERTHVHT